MYKIGFVGNSCTGKTTSCFNLVKELKFMKRKTGYVNDICRFVTFDPSLFDVRPEARLNVLFRQFANEAENELRNDVEFLLTERTVMDWALYYQWTCQNIDVNPDENILQLCRSHEKSYDLLFYMDSESMDYINDGYRPASTKIRDEINSRYIDWFESNSGFNVIHITSPDIRERTQEVEDKFMGWYKGLTK